HLSSSGRWKRTRDPDLDPHPGTARRVQAGILRLDGLCRPRAWAAQATQCCGVLSGWDSGRPVLGAYRLCPDPKWPDTGLNTAEVIGNRHLELAALLEE